VGRDLPGWQPSLLRKKGLRQSVKPSVARARSGWYWSTVRSSAGVRLESASPGEATLAEATLAEVPCAATKSRPRQKPKRVIADRGYDSDPLRERFKKRGIDLIVPYRKNNKATALRRWKETPTI